MVRKIFVSVLFLGVTFLFGTPDTFAGSDCSGSHCLDVWSSCGQNTASWGYSVNNSAREACQRAGGTLRCSYSGSSGPGSYTRVPAGRKEVSVSCSCAGITLEASSSCTVTHLPMIASIQGPSSFTLGDSVDWTLSGGYNGNDPSSDRDRFDYSISGLPLFAGVNGSHTGFGSIKFSSSTSCPNVGQCQYKGYDCCGGGSCGNPVCKIENGQGRYCFNFSTNKWDQVGNCSISCGTYTISAKVSGYAPNASATKRVTVNCPQDDPLPPRPQDPPDVNLSANPISVENGQSTTLRWTTSGNPDRCIASEGWNGSKMTRGGSESVAVNFGSSTTKRYTITCSKSGYQDAVDRVTVTKVDDPTPPDPAPRVTLTANPTSVVPGGQVRLSWTTSGNPDSCRAVNNIGGWFGEKNPSGGSQSITAYFPSSNTQTYEIICSKPGHNPVRSRATVSKINNPAPQVNLTANPISLQDGQDTTLRWITSGNPDSCQAYDGWTGGKNTNGGSESIRVFFGGANSKTYTIVCSKSGHNPARSSVTVRKTTPSSISVDLSAIPSLVEEGGRTVLGWYTTGNPDSCEASGGWFGQKSVNGGLTSQIVRFGTARQVSYIITCTKGGQKVTATAIVRKKDSPQPTPITVSLTANPISLQDGQDTTLRWTTTGDPDSCRAVNNIGGWLGEKNPSGGSDKVTVNFGGSDEKTYTLTCSKPGVPDVSDSVIVTKELPKLSLKKAEDCSGTQPARIQFGQKDDRAQLTACNNSAPVSGVTWINEDSDCIEVSEKTPTTRYFTAKQDPSCNSTVHIEKSGYENSDKVNIGVYDGGTDGEAPINIDGSQWKEVAP